MCQIFTVSAVLALAVAQIDVLFAAAAAVAVVNLVFLAVVDIDPDGPHNIDKLGAGTSYLAQFSVIILKF